MIGDILFHLAFILIAYAAGVVVDRLGWHDKIWKRAPRPDEANGSNK